METGLQREQGYLRLCRRRCAVTRSTERPALCENGPGFGTSWNSQVEASADGGAKPGTLLRVSPAPWRPSAETPGAGAALPSPAPLAAKRGLCTAFEPPRAEGGAAREGEGAAPKKRGASGK